MATGKKAETSANNTEPPKNADITLRGKPTLLNNQKFLSAS